MLCLVPKSLAQTVEDDVLLVEIVSQQSRDLYANDTLPVGDSAIVLSDTLWQYYPHPLCIPLMYIPETMPSLRDTAFQEEYTIANIRRNARRYITHNHADLYVSISDTNRLKAVENSTMKVHRAIVKDFEEDQLDATRALRNLRSPWRKEANLALQVTQNYATENWQQGGVNAFAMLWNAKAFANYKQDNISWQNSVEWRVGLSTVSGDTIHKINTTDDVFQIYSKLGYQVHPKWYITMFVDFRTNLFPSFQKNSNKVNTTFFTPIRYAMGVGLDYKPIKGLSINLSPATYKLVYANLEDPEMVDVTTFGIEQGERMLNEIGSSLRVEWKWRPLREIELETKFYFFTNYKQIETELEIDVDFIINKYLSAKLMLHPRYDGTIEIVTDKKERVQFKELISVGFSHTFR
jgi:hypothetical protein